MAYGKTIELFLVNGTADSLITAELSNWNGKAIKVPRIEIASCSREDITQTDYYLTTTESYTRLQFAPFCDFCKCLNDMCTE